MRPAIMHCPSIINVLATSSLRLPMRRSAALTP
jgi:hypothetical protein